MLLKARFYQLGGLIQPIFLIDGIATSHKFRYIFFPFKYNSQQKEGDEDGVETGEAQISWLKLSTARL